jgi:hypothetical protein
VADADRTGGTVKTHVTAAVLAGALAVAGTARGWEGPTTHAGLTEAAAIGSHLHARLRALGFERGLYEPLTIPPEDAKSLIDSLRQYPPTAGFVPDARGRQYALAWLVGGAVIADGPFAQNHFFDVETGHGWRDPARGAGYATLALLADLPLLGIVRDDVLGAPLPGDGVPAPDWIVSPENPLGLSGFLDQYAKAVRDATPGERSRAMAGALVAAGAIVHALEDMGSPAHVRGDEKSFVEPIGTSMTDLGSRFERIAALAYGRAGVPGASRVVTRPTLRAFFTSKEGDGLADITATHWFSAGTLPGVVRIGTGGRTVAPPLAKAKPAPPLSLKLMAAGQPQGTTLEDEHGVCLARYRVERGVLSWWLDDDCLLQQITAMLPDVTSYSAGALDYLFRGELEVTVAGHQAHAASAAGLGAGRIELLAEDARGVRRSVVAKDAPKGADLASLSDAPLPDGTVRAIALFTGVDAAGEPIVAVGAADVK